MIQIQSVEVPMVRDNIHNAWGDFDRMVRIDMRFVSDEPSPRDSGPTHSGPTHSGPTHSGPTHSEYFKVYKQTNVFSLISKETFEELCAAGFLQLHGTKSAAKP